MKAFPVVVIVAVVVVWAIWHTSETNRKDKLEEEFRVEWVQFDPHVEEFGKIVNQSLPPLRVRRFMDLRAELSRSHPLDLLGRHNMSSTVRFCGSLPV